MKSVKNGKTTSKAEITNISEHGFWLYYNDKEYLVSFAEFPWFRDCKLSEIFNFKVDKSGNFHWPDLDIDLNTKILENPEKYPLNFEP